MPRYDYFCPNNGRTLEVSHNIHTEIHTWGELCQHAKISPEATPLETPVQKVISGGMSLITKKNKDDHKDAYASNPKNFTGGGCSGCSCLHPLEHRH